MEKKERIVPDFDQVILGRNKSYRNSVWLGLVGGLFYGPMSFLRVICEPIIDLVLGVLKLLIGIPIWIVARGTFLVMAICAKCSSR